MDIRGFVTGIPNIAQMSQRSRLFLVAYFRRNQGDVELTRRELEGSFTSAGLQVPRAFKDVLDSLTVGSNAPLIKAGQRYSLSVDGVDEIEAYLDSVVGMRPVRRSLDRLVAKVTEGANRRFLAEVIACVQVNAKRAAVVLCWCLAVDHMQEYVLRHKTADFNAALNRRTDRLKSVKILMKDDFSNIRSESVFIELLRSASIITNDVRKVLEQSLDLRNTCAHPAAVEVPEAKAIGVIEDLVENVILRYPL